MVVVANSDDDLSTSSTLTENAVKEVQLQQQLESSKNAPAKTTSLPPKRTVRFNEESNQYHESTQSLMCKEKCIDDDDDGDKGECIKQLLWYSRRECRDFRDANDTLARKIAHAEGGYLTMKNPFGYQNVMQRVYESCCMMHVSPPPSTATTTTDDDCDLLTVEERELRRWLTLDVNGETCDRWGMERMIVSSIAMDRFYRRHALMDLVYHLQEEFETSSAQKKNGNKNINSTNDDSALDRGSFDECLRFHCEALTRPSCLFALQLGQATAAATNSTTTTSK